MSRPILSIIIPTKNRYYYLRSCLCSLLPYFNIPEVEIIITDNSYPKEDLQSSIDAFSNVNYSYEADPISQVENFELAMEKLTGLYVTMIGDDDSISKNILDVVAYMKKNDIEALNSSCAVYYWPGITSRNILNNLSAKLFLKSYTYKFTEVNCAKEVKKCLQNGGIEIGNLPRIYYGIIKKNVLDKIKASSGNYFPGPSPDMASSFTSALFIDKVISYDAPIFIAGKSPPSASALGLSGKHVGSIEGNSQLPQNCHLLWSSLVPKYWSGVTIYAESIIQSINGCKISNRDLSLNYYKLYASCLVFNPEYWEKIYESIQAFNKDKKPAITALKIRYCMILIWKLRFISFSQNFKNRMLNRLNVLNGLTYEKIENIEDASKNLNQLTEKKCNYELLQR
jgi:hypothetical protein